MKVMMLGLRGFPNVQGGVEKHVEHLAPLLAQLGCEMTVIGRAPYRPAEIGERWREVRLRWLWAPRRKSMETLVHTLLGVLYAGFSRPDVLHLHAIGPGLMVPLARLLGLKVVLTHHGPDYDRQKWGRIGRFVLRLGEALGVRLAHERIVISQVIRGRIERQYGLDSILIPNGVELPQLPATTGALDRFGLAPSRYLLLVSRLVPEKRHLDLIAAFAAAALPGWKLALVGDSEHPDVYSRQVSARAGEVPGVVCTGFQTGLALRELYAHAGLFVLPSSHEGLPIALLEALSYGLPVLASDIPANRELGLADKQYFPLGDIETLALRIRDSVHEPQTPERRESRRTWVGQRYDWNRIAEQTLAVYGKVVPQAQALVSRA